MCYLPKPKAEADNTNRGLNNSSYPMRTEFNNCFTIYFYFLSMRMEQSDWLIRLSQRAVFLHPARCEMQPARCEMQPARCEMQPARCEIQYFIN